MANLSSFSGLALSGWSLFAGLGSGQKPVRRRVPSDQPFDRPFFAPPGERLRFRIARALLWLRGSDAGHELALQASSRLRHFSPLHSFRPV